MSSLTFQLDHRLAADTHWLCDWPQCTVLLMNDRRYPWIVLVPKETGAVEIFDLPPAGQLRMWREVTHASELLKHYTKCKKINVGALGNVVSQLHVHIVARREADYAGNGPVWGQGVAEPYPNDERETVLTALRALLHPPGD